MAKIQPLNWFLWTMDGLRPILFWLHRSVPAKHAPRFFLYMQEVFNGSALDELQGLNVDLRHGLDHVLRVLATAALENPAPEYAPHAYSTKKLRGACAYFSDYLERQRGGDRTFSADREEWANLTADQVIGLLCEQLTEHAARLSPTADIESGQLRLSLELLNYLSAVRRAGNYLDTPESIMQAFQTLIEPYFRKRFGISLPGTESYQDLADWEEVKILCHSFWKDETI